MRVEKIVTYAVLLLQYGVCCIIHTVPVRYRYDMWRKPFEWVTQRATVIHVYHFWWDMLSK
jgi:hypothetical protein